MMIYVVWTSTGRWASDRTEHPVGVFTDRAVAIDAAKQAELSAPHSTNEHVFAYVYELKSLDQLQLKGGEEIEWEDPP